MEYEFQRFRLPRTISRAAVRRLLTERAEYGGWELARLRLYADGTRRVEEDVDSADRSGVAGTPTFFINERRHDGAYDIETLSAAVRAAGARSLIA